MSDQNTNNYPVPPQGASSAQQTNPMPGADTAPVMPQDTAPLGAQGGYTNAQDTAQLTAPANAGFTNAQSTSYSTPGSFTNTASASSAAPVPPTTTPVYNAANTAPKKKSGSGKTFAAGFAGAALACVLGLGGFGIYQAVANNGNNQSNTGSSTSSVTLGSSSNSTITATDPDETLSEAVAEKCLPSVVCIDVYTSTSSLSSMYGYGSGSNSSSSDSLTESSLGSGVVLSEDGYIITNYHVVSGADALKVTIEGAEYDAEVVGTDSSSDIAVIKAKDASGLTPIELGDSDDLTIGEWVMTIGSPFGLEQSAATGIVSATSRSQIVSYDSSSSDYYGYGSSSGSSTYMIYPNLIQTDAAINPGNSGGALVDSNGKLIGINTLITSYSGNYSGVGFAIPVNYAVNIAQQIIEGKTPTHAQLGVSLSSVSSSYSQMYGLSSTSGAYVSGVYTNSGAESAGIQKGDIITEFDGNKVESASDLMLDVRAKNPGDSVKVKVNRDGQEMEFDVTLGSDEDTNATLNSNSSSDSNSNGSNNSGNSNGYGYGNSGSDGYGYGYGSGSGSSIQDLLNELFGNGYSGGSGNNGNAA